MGRAQSEVQIVGEAAAETAGSENSVLVGEAQSEAQIVGEAVAAAQGQRTRRPPPLDKSAPTVR